MNYTEEFYEQYYKVITLLGNPEATDGQVDEVLRGLNELFSADAAFIYEANGSRLKLTAAAYSENAPALPSAAQTQWLSAPAVHFGYCVMSTVPFRNELGETTGVVGIARVKDQPFARGKADSIASMLFALGTYCKLRVFQRRIERLAFRDALTGVFNRRKFEIDFGDICARAANGQARGFVFFFDLDQFKKINDVFGHDIGDKLLLELARFLDGQPGLGGRVYRYGGDEFVAFTDDPSEERLLQCIDKLFEKFALPWSLSGMEVYCTASVGISRFPQDGISYDELLKTSDSAMYAAKRKGKNTYAFFDPDYGRTSPEIAKEFALRRAVADGCKEFVLLMHPVVDAKTGHWVGAENLVRWDSPEFGLLRPKEFIPLCEQLGLIAQLGDWIVTSAVDALKRFSKYPGFYVSVNTSPAQLWNERFIAHAAEAVDSLGDNEACLRLMIELTNPEDRKLIMHIVDSLHEAGVMAAADGLGLAHRSLSMMTDVDFDIVKVDCTMGMQCLESEFDREFARSLVRLSRTAGMKICAEGVSNEGIKDFLVECGYDYLQGENFAMPMTVDEFVTALEKNRRTP